MSGKNQHVVPHEGGWAVKSAGGDRATKIHSTQSQAIAHTRCSAKNQASELLIHGRDGQIRARDTFGHEPYPPKG